MIYINTTEISYSYIDTFLRVTIKEWKRTSALRIDDGKVNE